ncbi:hypothetical protein [Salinibacillus xinjiangensis]|uniref:Phenylalanine-tRNA ligase class II N-terminal domain-containing protein n=1 Tax=Salinibacillus xinjiangensis TaxID=1229268 RepID=A0A6G1X4V4_9BACI|nr:hypothetical protein [Salinibacillus xinjiangensis]MRG85994.1 hypothetical protein [Salinibacillus xinjiangensis]
MGKLSAEERPKVGQIANEAREEIAKQIEERQKYLEKIEIQKKLADKIIII